MISMGAEVSPDELSHIASTKLWAAAFIVLMVLFLRHLESFENHEERMEKKAIKNTPSTIELDKINYN